MMVCSWLDTFECFRGTYCFHLRDRGSTLLRKVVLHFRGCRVSLAEWSSCKPRMLHCVWSTSQVTWGSLAYQWGWLGGGYR